MTLEGLNEDFRDLLVLLADAGVEFVVVGAYALAFHGAPRASGDIDLFGVVHRP
jgi:predicted nucleotidyltransferase